MAKRIKTARTGQVRGTINYSIERPVYDVGEELTVQGEAQKVSELVTRFVSGLPLPIAREPLDFSLDINEITEDHYDFPDLEKYSTLTPMEQWNVRQNHSDLLSHINSEFKKRQTAYEAESNTKNGPTVQPIATPQGQTGQTDPAGDGNSNG
jgi:hypothetical protein